MGYYIAVLYVGPFTLATLKQTITEEEKQRIYSN